MFCRSVIQKMSKKSSSKTSRPVLPSPAISSWDMPKKSSSKAPKPVPQSSAAANAKSSSTPKTFGHEIEEIFSKKRKKPEHEKTRKVADVKPDKLDEKMGKDSKKENARKKRSRSGGSNVDVFEKEQAARPKRKTADGLVIYSEEDLGIGRADAGGTRLCPFDCDCCF
ncbi:hypothetical protein L6452_35397 [Arctium lappa]|uniref:Uncharacterized protein n=1 Tax=Arctium lappa TaxID=4217 RepID=A0ACB8Y6Y3_ARCLA|nr:hypothetical protein L6452_35397 [Arctium lappa]